jgi:hypothetical protein
MATWFWVAAAPANMASVNWATSSGGSPTGQPTTGDLAILDGGSSQQCTINAAISLLGLDCQGGTGNFAGTLVHNAFTVTITGTGASALRFSPGMTYSPVNTSSLFTFTSTSGTAQLTSAGKKFAALTLNGAGGTVQQKDDLNVNAVNGSPLTITTGVWDAYDGGAAHAITANGVISTGALARSLLLGGLVTLGGNLGVNGSVWNVTASLTLTKNAANIVVLAPNPNIVGGWNFIGGGLTYNGLTLNAVTNKNILSFTGANIFSSLSVGAGWVLMFPPGTTTTINTAFTFIGTQANPISILSNGPNGQTVLSVPSGSCSLTWGCLSDVSASGGATFTADNVLDLGSNTGWAITPPVDHNISAAAIATAVWQDLLAGSDFSTAASVGALLKAMSNLQYTVPTIGRGTVGSGATTTSITTSAFSIVGKSGPRSIVFDPATTTANLRGQGTPITSSTGGPTPTFTVAALTDTPQVGDTFSVM